MTQPSTPRTDFELVRTLLPSGLPVLCAPLHNTHRAAVTLHVRSGSRFEPAELGGVSHFLEHMLHRGTRRFPSAHELALAFEELGSELGAATNVDHALLSAGAPPENLEAVLALLAEVAQEPVFSGIEIERGIVREEILESLNDEGEPIDADELLISLAFPGHGLGRPITGTLETLARFDHAVLRRFHAEHYHAGAMVVSVSGPVDPERVLAAAERAFAALPGGAKPSDVAPTLPMGPGFRYVREPASQTALRVAFQAPSEKNELEPASELLLRVLDDGMSTRLYHEVCDERGLAYDVSAAYEAFEDAGLFSLSGDSAPTRSDELLGELFAVTRSLRDSGPTARELDKAKRRFAWQMQALFDDPGELAAFVGLGELTGVARTPAERWADLEGVTHAAVQRAAQSIFVPEGLSVAAVGQLNARQRSALESRVRAFGT